MHITILAFNYEYAGNVVNGPGMCLKNFSNILRRAGISFDIFTVLSSKDSSVKSIKDTVKLNASVSRSNIIHVWSGLSSIFKGILKSPLVKNKKIILGPNLLDGVELKKEKSFMLGMEFDKVLTLNKKLKHELSIKHNIDESKIEEFLVGPDLKLWKPSVECDETILWKGNSKQFVKDVKFALKLRDALPEYKFKFIGYPGKYNYWHHINDAKKSKIQIVTSLSETMGLAMLEGWASGIPSVSHPKIYMHGENYKTGIITSKNIKDYADAVKQIMNDDSLYIKLREGSVNFMEEHFNDERILNNYKKIVL